MTIVTLEEHFLAQAVVNDAGHMHYIDAKNPKPGDKPGGFPVDLEAFTDLNRVRLGYMDRSGISHQVISHAPIIASEEMCGKINQELYAAIQVNPSRFSGFATLPMSDPTAASKMLRHCVEELKFLGALVDNHLEDGTHYDSERFWPVFEMAQKLDVPIYIHPTSAAERFKDMYTGAYDAKTSFALSAFGWGWHADTGLHILKLFSAGIFDRFPKLKIVIGHDGEMLPFQLDRSAPMLSKMSGCRRDLHTVWNENVWITTSGMFSVAPLACVLKCTKIDRIMFSVDYPFSTNDTAIQLIARLKESGLMTDDDLEKFTHKNAEILLKIQTI